MLHGQTCTPGTLQRADWLLRTLREASACQEAKPALSASDANLGAADLIARYQEKQRLAATLQVAPAAA